MNIEQKLEVLGYLLPHEIARLLEKSGIKGYPAYSNHCPIANFLNDGNNNVTVGLSTVVTNERTYYLPFQVQEFIKKFDDGRYPKLVQY